VRNNDPSSGDFLDSCRIALQREDYRRLKCRKSAKSRLAPFEERKNTKTILKY
jgi:hypothetical protein